LKKRPSDRSFIPTLMLIRLRLFTQEVSLPPSIAEIWRIFFLFKTNTWPGLSSSKNQGKKSWIYICTIFQVSRSHTIVWKTKQNLLTQNLSLDFSCQISFVNVYQP